jgi:hypothetical protein
MNKLVKTAVAGALALGASSAFAIGVPSSNSSDLILYVDALTASGSSAGVYGLDTGISLSSLMPGPFVTGAQNSTVFPGISKTIAESPTLSTFMSSHVGDSFGWTLEGGQYNNAAGFANGSFTSASNANSVATGSALAIFTSPSLTSLFPQVSTARTGTMQDFLNGLNGDVQFGGGLAGLATSTETGSGTESLGAPSKYGFFGGPDLASAGSTAIKLFGFTGGGVNGGTLQSYVLGSATFSTAGVLQINPNGTTTTTTVPLPAAVWLFGSGLMGLVGVSRRRKEAAAA